jgi:hypothetical protein
MRGGGGGGVVGFPELRLHLLIDFLQGRQGKTRWWLGGGTTLNLCQLHKEKQLGGGGGHTRHTRINSWEGAH